MSKIKEVFSSNLFLIKAVILVVVFVLEVLIMKLFIDTAHTTSFNYLAFNFQSTELPLYFLLIFLVISKGRIFNFKTRFEKNQIFYLIPHIVLITGFYFFTLFVIDNPSLVESNVMLFKIGWYGSALIPLVFLGFFLFSFDELKRFFSDFKVELGVSVVLSFVFLYLYEIIAPIFYEIGMLAANMAISTLKRIVSSFVVYPGEILTLRYGINSVRYSPLCSGVIGYVFLLLFYLLFFTVNHKRLDKAKTGVVFVIGLVFFFIMDYLRNLVSLWVWTLNPNLGVQLFHSNVRPLYYTLNLLIIYFVFRRWIFKASTKSRKKAVKKKSSKKKK